MKSSKAVQVSPELVKDIALKASVDERSVWKRLAGGTLRPLAQQRIDRELAARREEAK